MDHRRAAWEYREHGDQVVLVPELRAIATSRAALEFAQKQLADAVNHARREGFSWEHIALPLGISRQSAWERWRRAAPEPEGMPPIAEPEPVEPQAVNPSAQRSPAGARSGVEGRRRKRRHRRR
jgi:hypothetical protein